MKEKLLTFTSLLILIGLFFVFVLDVDVFPKQNGIVQHSVSKTTVLGHRITVIGGAKEMTFCYPKKDIGYVEIDDFKMRFTPTSLLINDKSYELSEKSTIVIEEEHIRINGLKID